MMASSKSRYGEWAVVTGASDGIGRAFAVLLAEQGVNLVLVARREPLLAQLATELRLLHGVRCTVLAADLADAGDVLRVTDATEGLDVGMLVAAAGFGTSGPLAAGSLHDETAMLAVNCEAVLSLSWHFSRRFMARKRGALVLLSSIVAFQGVPLQAHYAATKAYVQTLAEGLRVELAPYGVDVLAVAPGPVATGFAARANLQMAKADTPGAVAAASLAALGRKPTVRPGFLGKLLGHSLALLPRWSRLRVMTQVSKRMTAHQPPPKTVPDPSWR